jgi:HEAT repeat protein
MRACPALSFCRVPRHFALLLAVLGFVLAIPIYSTGSTPTPYQTATLTPRQRQIAKEQQRLGSEDVEERRDAVMRLGLMHHPDASRVALAALKDPAPVVRATAAKAILALPPSEVVGALIPLLDDSDEFVRQEAAYALGQSHSRAAVPPLAERLLTDKKDGVRAGAAVALGEVADNSALPTLIQCLTGHASAPDGKAKRKPKPERNDFVLRAVAAALGRIGDRAAVPALVAILGNEKVDSDVKREAARSLGMIADPAAVPALQSALTGRDPYLARTASEALLRISRSR